MANDKVPLKKIHLCGIVISPEAWERFAKSLLSVKHDVEVTVHYQKLEQERSVDSRVVRAIFQIPCLKYVRLETVGLDDGVLMVTYGMRWLQKIALINVSMSPEAWDRLGTSLGCVKHDVDATIEYDGDKDILPLASKVGHTCVDADHDTHIRIVRAILKIPLLKHLVLRNITLDDDLLIVTDDMTHLEKTELFKVSMSPEAWNAFVISLLSMKHFVDVTIECCNIDRETDDFIFQSGKFGKTKKEKNWIVKGWRIQFTNIPEVVV